MCVVIMVEQKLRVMVRYRDTLSYKHDQPGTEGRVLASKGEGEGVRVG